MRKAFRRSLLIRCLSAVTESSPDEIMPAFCSDSCFSMRLNAYVPGVDGLRAIAITSVVLFHAGFSLFCGGFVGVDIFFVISGFLISSQIQSELRSKGRFNVIEFYARRIRRLLPAMTLVMAVTLTLSYYALLPQALPAFIKSAAAVILIHANNFFEAHTGGYFDTATDLLPFLHTWSLSVEEQIYVVWPLILVLMYKAERRVSVRLSLTAIIVLFVASLAACVWETIENPHKAFYLAHFRVWEFALGAGVGELRHRLTESRQKLPDWLPGMAVALGVTMQLASLLLINSTSEFPGYIALLPCSGTSLALFGLCQSSSEGWATAALQSRPVRRIGLLSYSWYLWHWPLLAMWRSYALGRRNLFSDSIVAIVALVLAELTYRYVETPVRQRRHALFKSLRGTYLSAAFATIVLVIFGHFLLLQGRALIVQTENQIGGIDEPLTQFSKCTLTPDGLYPITSCIIGDRQEPSVLVWGDSHTEQIFPGLLALAESRYSYLVRFHSSCPPLLGVKTVSLANGREDDNCHHSVAAVKAELDEERPLVKKVVLLARWNYYLGMQVPEPGDFKPTILVPANKPFTPEMALIENQKKILAEGLHDTFSYFAQKKIPLYVVAPIPEYSYSVPGCLLRHSVSECDLGRSEVNARRQAFMSTLLQVAADFDQVKVVETIDRFCDEVRCAPSRDGGSLYKDSNHLNHRGSAELASYLYAELQ